MSIPKWFWVYIKNWACLKNLSILEPNFEEADGLGISNFCIQVNPKAIEENILEYRGKHFID